METLETKIANLIAQHGEIYDSDCGEFYGCACGFKPTNTDEPYESYNVPWDTDHIATLIIQLMADNNK